MLLFLSSVFHVHVGVYTTDKIPNLVNNKYTRSEFIQKPESSYKI